MTLPAPRPSTLTARRPSRAVRAREHHRVREAPLVPRAVDADVLRAGLHAERIEQAMVVVRIPVELVHRDVELVGAFDKVEAVDREHRLCLALDADGLELLDVRIRA